MEVDQLLEPTVMETRQCRLRTREEPGQSDAQENGQDLAV